MPVAAATTDRKTAQLGPMVSSGDRCCPCMDEPGPSPWTDATRPAVKALARLVLIT